MKPLFVTVDVLPPAGSLLYFYRDGVEFAALDLSDFCRAGGGAMQVRGGFHAWFPRGTIPENVVATMVEHVLTIRVEKWPLGRVVKLSERCDAEGGGVDVECEWEKVS